MDLSPEELNFFSEIFKPNKTSVSHENTLTLQSDVPADIAQLLSNANLTLLAEVAHYQLWFPLNLKVDGSGSISPVISAPEVIDTQGTQRSWRWSKLDIKSKDFCIESLSSTGIFLKPLDNTKHIEGVKNIEFTLPNDEKVCIKIEPIRQSKQGIAAKIISIDTGKEALKAYLFEEHKRQYAALYDAGVLIDHVG